MFDVSISIVTHNSIDEIGKLLSSFYEQTKNDGLNYQVFVVDNESTDQTISFVRSNYPGVTVIENENKGFGHGHNRVLPLINSQYHAVVNPDIVFTCNVFKTLVGFMNEYSSCALATPCVMNEDGTVQHLPKRTPTLKYMVLGRLSTVFKVFDKYRAEYTMRDHKFDKPEGIEFATGCFMFFKTSVFKKCEGFDEQFFMYMEDADLSLRAAEFGKVVYYPHASVTHQWERTSHKKLKFLIIHIKSMIKFMKKHRQLKKAKRGATR